MGGGVVVATVIIDTTAPPTVVIRPYRAGATSRSSGKSTVPSTVHSDEWCKVSVVVHIVSSHIAHLLWCRVIKNISYCCGRSHFASILQEDLTGTTVVTIAVALQCVIIYKFLIFIHGVAAKLHQVQCTVCVFLDSF